MVMRRSRARRARFFPLAAALAFASGGCGLIAGIRDLELAPAEDAGPAEAAVNDAPSGDSALPDVAVDGAISLSIDPVSVYLGRPALLVARVPAGTTDVTFKWTINLAPQGSTITTSSLIGATGATPSFQPDLEGTYVVTAEATHLGAVMTAQVQVHVFEASVFYIHTQLSPSTVAFFRSIGTGGGVPHSFDCFTTTPQGPNEGWGARVGGAGFDFWEAPPGVESRVAFIYPDTDPDSGSNGLSLITATTSSTGGCTGSRIRRDEGPPVPFLQPRFSPDGTRIAYVRAVPGAARIATVGFDGTNAHFDIAPVQAYSDGGGIYDGSIPYAQPIPQRPQWKDATHVGWIQPLGGSYQIALASDQDQQSPSLYMRCALPTPLEFLFLPNGDVVASTFVPGLDGGQGATDLLVLRPDATTRQCSVVRNLTRGIPGASFNDFALSPDATQLASAGFDPSISGGAAAYVVPVDGSGPPLRLAAPGVGAGNGPRWVASGALLAYGANNGIRVVAPDAGQLFGPDAALPDAGADADAGPPPPPFDAGPSPVRTLVQASGSDHTYGVGNGVYTGCSMGTLAGGSAATLSGASLAFALLVARRRRRRR
jgi:hypothetical protein